MEIMFFQKLRSLGGLRYIQKAENRLKMKLVVEGLQLQIMIARMIGEQMGFIYTTVHQILTNNLEMWKICAK